MLIRLLAELGCKTRAAFCLILTDVTEQSTIDQLSLIADGAERNDEVHDRSHLATIAIVMRLTRKGTACMADAVHQIRNSMRQLTLLPFYNRLLVGADILRLVDFRRPESIL